MGNEIIDVCNLSSTCNVGAYHIGAIAKAQKSMRTHTVFSEHSLLPQTQK